MRQTNERINKYKKPPEANAGNSKGGPKELLGSQRTVTGVESGYDIIGK